MTVIIGQIYYVFVLISSLFYFISSLRRGDQSTVFAQYLLILTDPGLLRSGTRLHWFVAVVLLILEDFFNYAFTSTLEFRIG